MCICGFVCVPLIAFFGAGAAGIGAPAIVAGMEKNGKAGATATDVSTNDCGKSEDEVGAKDSPLKTLCETQPSGNSGEGAVRKGVLRSANGTCMLCYEVGEACECADEGGEDGDADEDESSPVPGGPCMLCYGDAASCGCEKEAVVM
jgi:hypothetical protein